MGRKKGSVPWNKGLKYSKELKSKLNLDGLDIGRKKGIKKPGLSKNNPMFKKEVVDKVKNNPAVQKNWFRKGHIPWTKGKKGIHFSPETEFKEGVTTGESHPSWKGGITPINKRIRSSNRFKNWRRKIFERDNYTCQMCKKRGEKLHANHIKKFSEYKALRFDINNGITLCKFCHMKIVTHREEDWEKLLILLLNKK